MQSAARGACDLGLPHLPGCEAEALHFHLGPGQALRHTLLLELTHSKAVTEF